ncbi:MAG: hypothetical protein H7Z41_14925 [Cytophagales bacterium]|nr:hypothetical protein [Armatimonadota bacterium]
MNPNVNLKTNRFLGICIAGALLSLAPLSLAVPVRADQTTSVSPNGEGLLPSTRTVTAKTPLLLRPRNASWDFSRRTEIRVTVHNTGNTPATLLIRAENAGSVGTQDACRAYAILAPGATQTVVLPLKRRPEDPTYAPFSAFFMYTRNINVRDNTLDSSAIAGVTVALAGGTEERASVRVTDVRASGETTPGPVPFYPFVDRYGQYTHTEWPGKIHRDEDFTLRLKQEDAEMKTYSGPSDWDKWGGWAKGPKRTATGRFYTAKHEGKWWLVDPDGHLFFSYGPTGVGFGEGTPVTGRENWFSDLPSRTDRVAAQYWGQGKNARFMYYQGKSYDSYDFSGAAAEAKYGPNWRKASIARMHRRLRNWGFNTVANWSSEDVIASRKTPYVVAIHYGGPWMGHMPDAFSPEFETSLRARLAQEKGKSADDPWCIGYFVDNELWWGPGQHGEAIAHAALGENGDFAAKRVFTGRLQAKYGQIAALNTAWGTKHTDWKDFLATKTLPGDPKNPAFGQDCGDFSLAFADKYFATVRRLVKEIGPSTLYLGCRFNGHIDLPVIQTAAKYCDVISYNVYDKQPGDRLDRYVGVVDKPFISGEFGVGSDTWETPFRGDVLSEEADARTKAVEQYINAAFHHPLMVGAHFFQFRDQPLTGRPDGEAVLRGFVDTTDTPHFDLVQANRRVAYNMYPLRAGSSKAGAATKDPTRPREEASR